MNLLKKGKFGWHNEAKAAFRALKKAMTTNFILAMPNFNDPFTIVTNAFRDSIGTILIQQGLLVVYMNRGLGINKQSWSVYAKEMLAILETIQL